MAPEGGLRERKKLEQRQRLADVAAELFAAHGYDDVSIPDVAEAAGVSYQTVYNYFPAKQHLVLDRAEEIREEYRRVVRERPRSVTPAGALRPLVEQDIERYRRSDLRLGRGEHPALCVASDTFRGFALMARERDAQTIADAITETDPSVHPLVARAHAAALVAVIQTMTDRVGTNVLSDVVSDALAAEMADDAHAALDELDRQFTATLRRAARTHA